MIQRASDVGVTAGLITAARAVNRSMPNHVASVLADLMWSSDVPASQARVLLLGWSYKAEVGDPRETPAKPLAENLLAKGITVGAWDPHIDNTEFPSEIEIISNIEDAKDYDLVVLVTAHKACLNLDWSQLLSNMRTPLLYDGRRVLDLDALRSIGWKPHALGRPSNV